MEDSGHPGFEPQSSQDRLLHSSPLDTLVGRTSSRRRQTRKQGDGSSTPPPLQCRHVILASPPRSFASQCAPDSPLLHSSFQVRNSTASITVGGVSDCGWQNSKSFLSFTEDCGFEEEEEETPSQACNGFVTPTSASWPRTGSTRPNDTELEDPMKPPSPLPIVVVSSPQDDAPNRSMRQPIVSQSQHGFPRLNFSRPGRPPIVSSEEQKRRVLERNAQRLNSPRMNPSVASLSPLTPVTGLYPDNLHTGQLQSASYLHPDGAHSTPSLVTPTHITLSSHPPSFRATSPSSLYSNSYSFYQLDSALPSPTPQSPPHSPPSPASSRFISAEPQTPQEYLQLGIQYHEANQLKDSAVCFEKSAKEQGGCCVGMLMWGLTLRHGWGCAKNEKGGFKWLSKAAELAVEDLDKAREGLDARGVKEELVLAIYEVGQCFFQGWGVAKDRKMAVSYYRVAAKLGDADAQQDLAFCLVNGKGCKKDKREAAKWYRAAVAQGASDVGMAWIYKDKYQN